MRVPSPVLKSVMLNRFIAGMSADNRVLPLSGLVSKNSRRHEEKGRCGPDVESGFLKH
jgi:hypothetical protein